MNDIHLGEGKVLEFRAAVLRLYLWIASVAGAVIVPVYYFIGIDALTLICAAFAAAMFVTTWAFGREHIALVTASRVFLASILLACAAGLWLGNESIDNKPWLLLIPVAAFTVAGSREGWCWSVGALGMAVVIFVLRWPAYELLSITVLVLAHGTTCGALYVFNRFNEQNMRTIARLSHTDSLTGAYNRQLFDELSRNLLSHARRSREPVAVYMIDIDHFKEYNDRYGHLAGDAALAAVARVIRSSVRRASDLVFRYGGEEFCVVSSAVDAEDACALAESIIDGVRSLAIGHEGSARGVLTVSVGLSHHARLSSESVEGVLQRADRALYDAKMHGRDRLELCASVAARSAGLVEASV